DEPRRPRRRRRPQATSSPEAGDEAQIEHTASAGETPVVEDSPSAPSGEGEPPRPPRRRRRRRRGPPREAGSQQATASSDAQAGDVALVNDTPQSAPAGDTSPDQRPPSLLPHDNVPRE